MPVLWSDFPAQASQGCLWPEGLRDPPGADIDILLQAVWSRLCPLHMCGHFAKSSLLSSSQPWAEIASALQRGARVLCLLCGPSPAPVHPSRHPVATCLHYFWQLGHEAGRVWCLPTCPSLLCNQSIGFWKEGARSGSFVAWRLALGQASNRGFPGRRSG